MINSRFGSYYKGTLPSSSGSGGWIPSAAAALFGGITGAIQQKKQRKASIKMEREARAWNKKMWDEINRYNHPINQMARLKEAGLNPNLIYGSSPGSAVGNAGQIHPGKAPEQAYSNFVSPAIGQFQNLQVQQAQTNNLKTQSNLNTSNAIKSIAQSGLAKAQENQITKLLSGNLELQQEQVKQSKIGTFLKTLEKTGKSKNYLAQQAALTNKMVADGEIAQAGIELAKLNQSLAKQGIRPTDPLYIKLLGQIFGMDLTNPTVQDEKNLKTFIQYLNK
tara:strand:- start:743 stop:1576 length:834 start_codon:yes stop_codon:yes gene_type:complete